MTPTDASPVEDVQLAIAALAKHLGQVGELLSAAAARLPDEGELPDASIEDVLAVAGDEIAVVRQRFAAASKTLGEAARALGLTDESIGPVVGLRQLQHLRDLVSSAKRAVDGRPSALAVLDRIAAVTYSGPEVFGPLTRCQAAAHHLRAVIEGSAEHPESVRLAAGDHPMTDLLHLIDRHATFEIPTLSEWEDRVERGFGELLGDPDDPDLTSAQAAHYLAGAAAAGRLTASPPSVDHQAPPPNGGQASGQHSSEATDAVVEALADPGTVEPPAVINASTAPSVDGTGSDQAAGAAEVEAAAPIPEVWEEAGGPVGREPVTTRRRAIGPAPLVQPNGPPSPRVAPPAVAPGHPAWRASGADAFSLRELGTIDAEGAIDEAVEPTATPLWLKLDSEIQQAARRALDAKGVNRSSAVWDLVWRLVANDSLGLAHHLAPFAELEGTDRRLPAVLFRAAALGRFVRYEAGDVAIAVQACFDEMEKLGFLKIVEAAGTDEFGTANEGTDGLEAAWLMLAAGALRPALLAPGTGAGLILQTARRSTRGTALDSYLGVLAAQAETGQAVNPNAVKQAMGLATWEDRALSLSEEIAGWWEDAPRKGFNLQACEQIWIWWLNREGPLRGLFDLIRNDKLDRLKEVDELCKQLSNRRFVRRWVDQIDKQVRQRGRQITATSYDQLLAALTEAVELAQRWLDLQLRRPEAEGGYLLDQARALQARLAPWRKAVDDDLERLGTSALPSVRAACHCLARGLADIDVLFDPASPVPAREPAVPLIVDAELLRYSTLVLDAELQPRVGLGPDGLQALLERLAEGTIEWATAARERAERGDHQGAQQVLDVLSIYPDLLDGKVSWEILDSEREKVLQAARTANQTRSAVLTSRVTERMNAGLVTEAAFEMYKNRIERMDETVGLVLDQTRLADQLAEIETTLDIDRASQVMRARVALDALDLPDGHPAFDMIEAALATSDVLTAVEYINELKRDPGAELPELDVPRPDLFGRFFPERLRKLTLYLESIFVGTEEPRYSEIASEMLSSHHYYLQNRANSYQIAKIEVDVPDRIHAQRAIAMIRAWLDLRQTPPREDEVEPADLVDLFTHLGFPAISVSPLRAGPGVWFDLVTTPLDDRSQCPIPNYGSLARGHYRVLCVWGPWDENAVLNTVRAAGVHGGPVIVLALSTISERSRRALAATCRDRLQTAIVIDDALVTHLSLESNASLPTLFACTLPFTYADPYDERSNEVPPELFYGRTRELLAVMNFRGGCFVFGGRQVGKTALLREVVRQFHNPARDQFAMWVNLVDPARGIDTREKIDVIWSRLREQMRAAGVALPAMDGPEHDGLALRRDLKAWLDASKGRLLLMLDEADRFLEEDGSLDRFARCSLLRGLMDESKERFKVVFAGLHHVQKTTHLANNPLVQLGKAIQVGPMFDDAGRDGRDLVLGPLEALGYRFADDDLARRILWQTNYYPGLIQVYCGGLLRDLASSRPPAFDARTSPPFGIESHHLEGAYAKSLRDDIRQRFHWTLDLDQHFRVIAFAIAAESTPVRDSFTVAEIRDLGLTWWQDGFSDERGSAADFDTLLEEMVGLGILRKQPDDRYALRSPNVVSLLGSPRAIEDELTLTTKRDHPPVYDPGTFQAIASGPGILLRRSPLTDREESDLRRPEHGVSIVVATLAAGLEHVAPCLVDGAFGGVVVDGIQDAPGLVSRLADEASRLDVADDAVLAESPGDRIAVLAVVPAETGWDAGWVSAAIGWSRDRPVDSCVLRVVFIADAARAWDVLGALDGFDGIRRRGVGLIGVGRWHDAALRDWLGDRHSVPNNPTVRGRIFEATGGWSALLQQFALRVSESPEWWDRLDDATDVAVTGDLRQEIVGDAVKLVPLFGLEVQEPRAVLELLPTGPIGERPEDVTFVLDNVDVAHVRRCLEWADLLGLAYPLGDDRWAVSDLVHETLQHQPVPKR